MSLLPEETLLIPFFQDAAHRLDEFKISTPCTTDDIRHHLLKIQSDCLTSTVNTYNANATTPLSLVYVENELRNLRDVSAKVRVEMERLNEAARLAFCRLVLYSECLLEHRTCGHCQSNHGNNSRSYSLKTSGRMERDEILEFIGMCEVAVRLPNVQRFLSSGNLSANDPKTCQLFPDIALPITSIFPQDRLEFIQRMILRAIGYDASHGYNEIKRIFFTKRPNEFSNDEELVMLFAKMSSQMDIAITNATLQATTDVFLSDHDQGGCTRVVAVNYSEKLVDPTTGEDSFSMTDATASISSLAPTSHTMEQQLESQQQQQRYLAKETAKLHQEILHQLLSMRDEDREARLDQARDASRDFMTKISQLPDPKDRIVMLQQLDRKTQRLLLMEKLWSSMLQENGGKPPKIG